MSFNPLMARLVSDLVPLLPESPSVIELGNQTLNLKYPFPWTPDGWDVGAMDGSSAELYYRAVGFSSYTCIDVNDRHGAIRADLNQTVDRTEDGVSVGGKRVSPADLVTNNGTGEHLFNQHAVFSNTHEFCAVGGLMLHVLPSVNWVNHGFYNYHPLLFVDLAAANGYEVVKLCLANRWGHIAELPTDERACEQVKPKMRKGTVLKAVEDIRFHEHSKTGAVLPNVIVVAALRKTRDEEFRMPMQGKYVSDITKPEIAGYYEAQA